MAINKASHRGGKKSKVERELVAFHDVHSFTRESDLHVVSNTSINKENPFLYQAHDLGYEYNKPGYFVKRKNGVAHLVCYTKSGKAIYESEGNRIELTEGSILFTSLAPETAITALDSHWEIYFMHVVGPNIEAINDAFFTSSGYYFDSFDANKFTALIERAITEYKKPEVDHYLVSELIYSLLMDILKQSEKTAKHTVITKALTYMNQHYAEKFNIDELAKLLYISKYFFIRKFHEETGFSPKAYLTNLRLQKAQTLLVQTNMSVQSIAEMVGFENEKNIYYAFKRNMNISPLDYRNRRKW